jgi:hypothetical protein
LSCSAQVGHRTESSAKNRRLHAQERGGAKLKIATGNLIISIDRTGDQSGGRISSQVELSTNYNLRRANDLRDIIAAIPKLTFGTTNPPS